MDSEKITAFLQEHWEYVSFVVGVVFLLGAIRNWNWMCDPTGKPYAHRYGRGTRRFIFGAGGCVLIVCSIAALFV